MIKNSDNRTLANRNHCPSFLLLVQAWVQLPWLCGKVEVGERHIVTSSCTWSFSGVHGDDRGQHGYPLWRHVSDLRALAGRLPSSGQEQIQHGLANVCGFHGSDAASTVSACVGLAPRTLCRCVWTRVSHSSIWHVIYLDQSPIRCFSISMDLDPQPQSDTLAVPDWRHASPECFAAFRYDATVIPLSYGIEPYARETKATGEELLF